MQENSPTLGWVSIAILIFLAAICDLISLIPGAGDITGPIYWTLVSIFLWQKGYGFLNPRRLATSGISMLGEIIPVIQSLPLTLVGIIIVIYMLKRRNDSGDKTKTTENNKREPQRPKPLNQNERREPARKIPLAGQN